MFTNDVLQDATITIILGNAHSSVYDRYEKAATQARELLESMQDDLMHNPSTEDVEQDMKVLEQAAIDVLDVARDAAGHRSALAALEDAFHRLSDQ